MRLTLNQYFINIAIETANRSTCTRAKVGAIFVRNNSVISSGYNGAPKGMPHCIDPGIGCMLYSSQAPDGSIEENCFRIVHAEINAINQAAKNGVSIYKSDLYCTHSPCFHCYKTLINTEIRTIYYLKPYRLETIKELQQLPLIQISF